MDSFELKSDFEKEFDKQYSKKNDKKIESEFIKDFEKDFNKQLAEFELIPEDKKSLFEVFFENKTFVYSILFYISGLLCGAFIYKSCQNDSLNSLLCSKGVDFLQLLLNNLSLYMLIFAVSVLLGVCLVGFPIINLIPLIIGFEAGMKICYYYINFGIKGVGYSLLMVAPYVCLFLTVIIYSVSLSYELSKNIYDIAIKKSDMPEDFNYRTYLKKYLAYAGLIIIVSVLNTAISYALSGIIAI